MVQGRSLLPFDVATMKRYDNCARHLRPEEPPPSEHDTSNTAEERMISKNAAPISETDNENTEDNDGQTDDKDADMEITSEDDSPNNDEEHDSKEDTVDQTATDATEQEEERSSEDQDLEDSAENSDEDNTAGDSDNKQNRDGSERDQRIEMMRLNCLIASVIQTTNRQTKSNKTIKMDRREKKAQRTLGRKIRRRIMSARKLQKENRKRRTILTEILVKVAKKGELGSHVGTWRQLRKLQKVPKSQPDREVNRCHRMRVRATAAERT